MSKIALSSNPDGTGVFTIASPNSNSDRILNLPDSAGTLATAESTLTQFNAAGSAPVYAARAWVNFDGTTSPGTIRASGNVSSVTRNGTGDYTVNFTTAMPDANYACTFAGGDPAVVLSAPLGYVTSATTSAQNFRIYSYSSGGALNVPIICLSFFR